MKKILIAGIFHETHSFVDESTPLDNFQIRLASELLDCTGDASPLGGALEYTDSQGWQIIPTIDIRATPSGTVEDAVFDFWWTEFESRWQPNCDAVLLILHGAMICQSHLDVEGELLRRIRTLPGAAG